MGLKKMFGGLWGRNDEKEKSSELLKEKIEEKLEKKGELQEDFSHGNILDDEGNSFNKDNGIKEEIVKKADTDEIAEDELPLSANLSEQEPLDFDEEENADEPFEVYAEKPSEKAGFFARLKMGLDKTRKSFNDKIDSVLKVFNVIDEDLFEELEEALIMADVGVETSLYIINSLREKVKAEKIKEPQEIKGAIEEIISNILSENHTDIKLDTKPSVIMVIGVNGLGKTTSIGKMAAKYIQEGKKVIIGAADTFRAAAIDQLQVWAEASGAALIKHKEGSDPAAVVFDTISAAKARGADVIILDTAGRLHNKKNLMDELNKIFRVMERELPDCSKEILLVLDATTGQNAVNQVKMFRESADITGIVLTKLDGSAKGGIVLAIAHEEKIPVKLVGVGEGINDLQSFDSEAFSKALFAE